MTDIVDVIEGRAFPRTEEVGCPLCGKRRVSRKIEVRFGMRAMVADCPDCRLAFQTPRPSPEATLAYMNWRWSCSDAYVADRKSQKKRALTQINFVKQFIDKPTKLLDFGAGCGSFVRVALDNGWDATGLERSDSAIARARDFYDVELVRELVDDRYDVVTMWDVVEHLREPQKVLAMIRELLVPGGLICLETGNFESYLRVVQKDEWGLYLFDHQFYFSPSSLQAIIERAGYKDFLLLPNPPRPKTVLRSILYSANKWHKWVKAKRQWPQHAYMNAMIAIARNPDE